MSKVYSVFFDGRLWDSYQSKLNAYREKIMLKRLFPNAKVTVMKMESPRYQ